MLLWALVFAGLNAWFADWTLFGLYVALGAWVWIARARRLEANRWRALFELRGGVLNLQVRRIRDLASRLTPGQEHFPLRRGLPDGDGAD